MVEPIRPVGLGYTPKAAARRAMAVSPGTTAQRDGHKPPPVSPAAIIPGVAVVRAPACAAYICTPVYPPSPHIKQATPWRKLSHCAEMFPGADITTGYAREYEAQAPLSPTIQRPRPRPALKVALGIVLALAFIGLGSWEYVYLRYYSPISETRATLASAALVTFEPRNVTDDIAISGASAAPTPTGATPGEVTEAEMRQILGAGKTIGIYRPSVQLPEATQAALAAPVPSDAGAVRISAPTARPAASTPGSPPAPIDSDTHFRSGGTDIQITAKRVGDSDVHIAEVILSDMGALRSAFAKDTFGRNIRERTTVIAERKNAALAINGDFYGYRDDGIVVRNGTLYRNKPTREMACLFSDGTMAIVDESTADLPALLAAGLRHTLSFGPSLVGAGGAARSDVDFAQIDIRVANPRTAIGMVAPNHFLFVTVDGRSKSSRGMTLAQLSALMSELGCTVAYNLDGGGSSAMVFHGGLINVPCGGVKGISGIGGERTVSDILYIGRE